MLSLKNYTTEQLLTMYKALMDRWVENVLDPEEEIEMIEIEDELSRRAEM